MLLTNMAYTIWQEMCMSGAKIGNGYNYYEVSVQEPENPEGPLSRGYRVLRGGCWKSLKEDLRCSRRHRNNPGTVNGTYGFRCAADVG